MRWRTKEEPKEPMPKFGERRIIEHFVFLPKKLMNGETVFCGFYTSMEEFKKIEYFTSNYSWNKCRFDDWVVIKEY